MKYLFSYLLQINSDTSVRVILKNEKSYREQVDKLKSRFSIQVFLISMVKLTRIDEVVYNKTETSL